MKKYFIGVDIGGSHISCALIDSDDGRIYRNKIFEAEVDSAGEAGSIIRSWQSVIQSALSESKDIAGIGFAIPGPFNYKEGISLIENVCKYDALFGINIHEEIRKIFPDRNKPVGFINDASGFALGEFFSGAGRNSRRTLAITLGTGFGSTFLSDGNICEAGDNVPPNGYLYDIPYRESISDDYFSTRWFIRRWKELTGKETENVKTLSGEAIAGNLNAQALFDEFADNMAEFIAPHLLKFQADTFVIGGNIAKASNLFLPRLKENLNQKGLAGIKIKLCELWERAPLIGAAMFLQSLANTKEPLEQRRKTTQFLAPEKAESTLPGHYDIYPAFPIGENKINAGFAALAEWIIAQKTVVIDGYEGIFWGDLIEQLGNELNKTGKQTRWHNMDAAMLSPDEINAMIRPYMGDEDSIFGKITDKKLKDWFNPEKLKKLQPDKDADINILTGCGAALAGWNAPLIYVDIPKNELQFRIRAGSVYTLGSTQPEDSRIAYKRMFFVDWQVLNEHKAGLLPQISWIVDGQRPDAYLTMQGNDLRAALSLMSRNYIRVRPWFEPGAWGGVWLRDRIDGLNKNADNLAWSFELMVMENGIMFESNNYRLEVSFDFLMYHNYREVLGDCAERFHYDFPVRFDFLDTFDGENLSVQCHPQPEYIREKFGMPFTQDETYYMLDCQNEPAVYLGFQEGINPDEFHKDLVYSEQTASVMDIEKYVQKHPAKKHDFFLIPNGTIHASGKDNLVLEISSAPYIFTFKMYDWQRLDLDGRPRPINIEHGMNNLYFERQGQKAIDEYICKPKIISRGENYLQEHLPTHPAQFYDVRRYTFDGEIRMETNHKFHVWMLVEGSSVILETENGMKRRFNYAETFIIPAAAGAYTIRNESAEKAMMVEAFMK